MARRSIASLTVAATVLAGAPATHAATELPRKSCPKRLADPEGDGNVYLVAPNQPMPTGPKADGLDITGVHLRLTDTELQVFLALKNIPEPAGMQPTDSAFRYLVSFKYGAKAFSFEALQASPNHDGTLPPDPKQYPKASTGPNTADQLTGATGTVDPAKDYVVWTAPRAKVEQNIAHALVDGDKLTDIVGRTYHHRLTANADADFTTATGDAATWTVGDDYCFGAPPASFTSLVVKNVQYGDPTTMTAKLVSEAGTPLAGKQVQFAVAGDASGAHTATTGADGVATTTFVPRLVAASTPYAVTATFAGDPTAGKAKLTGTLAVSAEKTAFAAFRVSSQTATTRTVVATLLDDDKKPVGVVKVDWYVNGRKVATKATNGAGQTTFSGIKAGSYVQVRFAGVSGKYLAATSAKVRV